MADRRLLVVAAVGAQLFSIFFFAARFPSPRSMLSASILARPLLIISIIARRQ
jgi:hypothetical protein